MKLEECDELLSAAVKKFGDIPNKRITDRINYELRLFDSLGNNAINELLNASKKINEIKNQGMLLVPRLQLNNSLIYFLLGISNVNPLPRYNCCHKCHSFEWGNKRYDVCPNCGTKVVEDGYDLDFGFLFDEIKKSGFIFMYSSTISKEYKNSDYTIRLFESPLVKLATKLNLSQEIIDSNEFENDEIIKCLDINYYSDNYKCDPLFKHVPFVGIGDLDSDLLQEYLKDVTVNSFDDVVTLTCMLHGTGVNYSCKKNLVDKNNPRISDYITSVDSLYKLLKSYRFDDEDAAIMVRETRFNGDGHLSSFSINKLIDAKVEDKYISFMRDISYIFYKSHIISHTRLSFVLAKIFLEEPIKYYKAFFSINKDLLTQVDVNDDYIFKYIESRNTELEKIYLVIVDMIEKGFNPKDLIEEIKHKMD